MSSRFASLRKSEMSLSKFLQMNWSQMLFRFLPFGVSQGSIRTLGRLYYLINRQEQALIREAIRRVFQGKIAAEQVQDKIQAAFQGIFDHYHEKLFVGYANFPHLQDFLKKQVDFQGLENLQEALAGRSRRHPGDGSLRCGGIIAGSLDVEGFPHFDDLPVPEHAAQVRPRPPLPVDRPGPDRAGPGPGLLGRAAGPQGGADSHHRMR